MNYQVVCPTGTPEAECRSTFQCNHLSDPANPPAAWRRLTVGFRDESNAFSSEPTIAFLNSTFIETTHPVVGSKARGTTYGAPDLRAFEWLYWQDMTLPPVATGKQPIFHGLGWTWVKNYGRSRPTVSQVPTGAITDQRLRSSVARLDVDEVPIGEKTVVCPIGDPIALPDPRGGGCPACGLGQFLQLATDPADPGIALYRPGFGRAIGDVQFIPPSVIAAVGASGSQVRIVAAGDIGAVEAGARAAVVFDRAQGLLLGSLVAREGRYALDSTLGGYSTTGGPTQAVLGFAGGTALVPVVSGKRQELRVFRPGSDVFVQYLQNGDHEVLHLLNHVTLTKPLAATFRAEDESYFVLDEVSRGRMKLWHFDVALVATLIAEWQDQSPTSANLATASDGSVVLSRVASGNTTAWKFKPAVRGYEITGVARKNGAYPLVLESRAGKLVFASNDERAPSEANWAPVGHNIHDTPQCVVHGEDHEGHDDDDHQTHGGHSR